MAPGTDLSRLAREITSTTSASTSTSPTPFSPATTHPIPILSSKGTKVLHPSLITQDFDSLRFEAAAARQLNTTPPAQKSHASHASKDAQQTHLSTTLISSPYNSPGHYLDLTPLSPPLHLPSLILAKALTALRPTRPDYATASYLHSLNFEPTILHLVRDLSALENHVWKEHSFYVVIFRSQLKELDEAGNELLYRLDYESHREACESGGLLKYWFGGCDGERRNLATCFWRSREDAHRGGLGPWHAKARAAGRTLYESIKFSTHKFTILDGAEGIRFEDWKEGGGGGGGRSGAHA